ncbi:MAG: type II secretion system F family protein [Acidimicrobiales bacterium]
MNPAAAAALGAGAGIGVLLTVASLRGRPILTLPTGARARRSLLAGVAGTAGALAGWLLTGWVAAGLALGAAAAVAPGAWTRSRRSRRDLQVVDAVATWTELLRDTIGAAAGLEHALVAVAPLAPAPIAEPVRRAAARLEVGPLPDALRGLAADLDHPSADFVLAALLLAAEREARDLAPLLGRLADAARDDASLQRRIGLDRMRLRTSVRVITGSIIVFLAGIALTDRSYLAPYDAPTGQLALVGITLVILLALGAMARLGRLGPTERFVGPFVGPAAGPFAGPADAGRTATEAVGR